MACRPRWSRGSSSASSGARSVRAAGSVWRLPRPMPGGRRWRALRPHPSASADRSVSPATLALEMDHLAAVGDPDLRDALLFARSHARPVTADELAEAKGLHRN